MLIKFKFGCNLNKVIFIISMQMKIIQEIGFEIFDNFMMVHSLLFQN